MKKKCMFAIGIITLFVVASVIPMITAQETTATGKVLIPRHTVDIGWAFRGNVEYNIIDNMGSFRKYIDGKVTSSFEIVGRIDEPLGETYWGRITVEEGSHINGILWGTTGLFSDSIEGIVTNLEIG